MQRVSRRRRIAVLGTAAAVVAAGLTVASTVTNLVAPAAAVPGVPAAPTVLFTEDFENNPPVNGQAIALTSYVRADGGSYTADPNWDSPDGCNGFVLSASESNPGFLCASYGSLQGLATALGVFNGSADPADNHVVAAFTDAQGGSPANAIEFRTDEHLNVGPVTNRFLAFGVNVRAVNCNAGGTAEPLLQFALVDENDIEHPVTGAPLNPCAGGVASATVQLNSTDSLLFTGSELGIVMRNANGTVVGNDHAFDDIRVLDVTPQLDKAFSRTTILPGEVVTLTFTVTNTSELGAKAGWSFTDNLPAGMVVAPTPNTTTTCTNGTVGALPGASSAAFGGDLTAGQTSCTLSVDVVTNTTGGFTNGSSNVNPIVGLNPPPDAAIGGPVTFACTTSIAYLAQGNNPGSQLKSVIPGPGGYTITNIGPVAAVTYNGMGMHPALNVIYGITAAEHLVRVDADGAVTDLGVVTGLTGPIPAGAFDAAGNYYVAGPSGLYQINYAVSPPTATAIALVGATDLPADVGVIGNSLWGHLPGTASFVRINPTTGVVTYFPALAELAAVSDGAAWTYGNGNLAIQDNPTGTIYQIQINDPDGAPTFELISASSGPPPDGNNDGTSCRGGQADLSAVKTVDPFPNAAAGDLLTWTITITNNGPGASSGYSITDTLPAGVTNPQTATPGCAFTGNVLNCIEGGLANGEQFVVTYTGNAPVAAGPVANSAKVTGNEEDQTPPNNLSTTTTVVSTPDVSVTKDAPTEINAGEPIVWTITVHNNGVGPSIGALVTDEVPPGVTGVSLTAPVPGCAVNGNTLECVLGQIDEGADLVIGLTGTVTGAAFPELTNTVTVSSPGDPDPSNNTVQSTTAVNAADLSISKTAPEDAPATTVITWELRVTNNGPGVATNALVIDEVPEGVVDVALVAPVPPGCTVNGNTVQCTIPSIAAGETVIIRISGRPTKDAKPRVENSASVTSLGDPDPSNNTASSTTRVRNAPSDVCLEPDVGEDGRPYTDHDHDVHSHSDERLHDHRHTKCDPERPHLHYRVPGDN